MIYDYRFLRTNDGITCFAKVVLDVVPTSIHNDNIKISITNAVSESWIQAAKKGVMHALDIQQTKRLSKSEDSFHIIDIIGTTSDTGIDAIYCAGFIAAWKALGGDESDVNLSWNPEDGWYTELK